MATLHLEVHYASDLAAHARPVDNLCAALVDLDFGSTVRVLRHERDRDGVEVDLRDPLAVHRIVVEHGCARGTVFHSFESETAPRHPRRFGEVMLRGRTPRTWLDLSFDEYVPARPIGDKWLFSNSISCTTANPRIGPADAHTWIRELFLRLVADADVLWGAAWNSEEFASSNLHDEKDGMWALGRDVRRSLPGLFWLNGFGAPYVELIGDDTLNSVPASVARIEKTVVVQMYGTPNEWSTESAQQTRERVLTQVGRRYFYDRDEPDRDTETADFGLPELSHSNALRVFTTDGKTFTVLPDLDV